jgi:hypothetical protein
VEKLTRREEEIVLAGQLRLLKLRRAAGIPIDIGTEKRTRELKRRLKRATPRRRRQDRKTAA